MKNIKVVAGIVVVVAIVVAVMLFSGSNNRKNQEFLRQAIRNQGELDSLSYRGNINFLVSKDGEGLNSADIVILGDAINLQDPDNFQMQFNINITDHGTLGGEENIIKTSIILDGKILYLKLDKLESVNFPLDLSAVLKQWIRIDDIGGKVGALGPASALGLNSSVGSQFNKEQLDEISTITQNADVLVVTKDLGMEDGQRRFAYRIDLDNLLTLITDISEAVGEEISAEELQKMEEAISKLEENLSATGEIWIADSNQISRITLVMELGESEESPAIRVNMDAKILNFNEEIKVSVPTESISFEEAFGLVMQGMLDSSATSAQ